MSYYSKFYSLISVPDGVSAEQILKDIGINLQVFSVVEVNITKDLIYLETPLKNHLEQDMCYQGYIDWVSKFDETYDGGSVHCIKIGDNINDFTETTTDNMVCYMSVVREASRPLGEVFKKVS